MVGHVLCDMEIRFSLYRVGGQTGGGGTMDGELPPAPESALRDPGDYRVRRLAPEDAGEKR